jgi:hypothetical protein
MKSIAIRKAMWHRMVSFFDGPARSVTHVNDADVLLQGVVYEADFPCPKCGATVHMDKIRIKKDDARWEKWTESIAEAIQSMVKAHPAAVAEHLMGMFQQMIFDKIDLSPQLGMCLIPQEAVGNQQGEALRRMLEANLRMPVLLMSNNVQMIRLKPIMQAEADRILEGAAEDGKAEGKLTSIPSGNQQTKRQGGEGSRAESGPGSPEDPRASAGGGDGPSQGATQDPQGDAGAAGQAAPIPVDPGAPPAPKAEPDPQG